MVDTPEPTFEAPGPGEWALDRSHYPGGTTPISEWLIAESMPAGLGRVFAEIGAPLSHIQPRFVNGFMYTRVWPLIGGDKPSTKLPPTLILKLVARTHPEFRRRAKAAAADAPERDDPCFDGRAGRGTWPNGEYLCYVSDAGTALLRWTDERTDTYGVMNGVAGKKRLGVLARQWEAIRSR